ncbi:hypothetical protein [Methylorubrum sp. SL192]|uniref:hypothetical protein n=1 Tax=Methylorubrum sp. SL192 TaxID=2995167 RepID=UPI002272B43C|nr:hypothetical protein [Methylorubrum sp. SL192]MCY1643236.1 hypothetical protein [Methylorubrum sp. SL192]
MADPSPTVGELFKAKAVTDEQVNAAVEVYLTDLEAGMHAIADGYVVDLDAAVVTHSWASFVLANEEASAAVRHNAVRTAILLARPQKT